MFCNALSQEQYTYYFSIGWWCGDFVILSNALMLSDVILNDIVKFGNFGIAVSNDNVIM